MIEERQVDYRTSGRPASPPSVRRIYQAVVEPLGELVEGVMHTSIAGMRVQLREPIIPFKDIPEAYDDKHDEMRRAMERLVKENPNSPRITLTLYEYGRLEEKIGAK